MQRVVEPDITTWLINVSKHNISDLYQTEFLYDESLRSASVF
jgi:hypothetical protein